MNDLKLKKKVYFLYLQKNDIFERFFFTNISSVTEQNGNENLRFVPWEGVRVGARLPAAVRVPTIAVDTTMIL